MIDQHLTAINQRHGEKLHSEASWIFHLIKTWMRNYCIIFAAVFLVQILNKTKKASMLGYSKDRSKNIEA